MHYGEVQQSILIDSSSIYALDKYAVMCIFEHESYNYNYTITSQHPINIKVYDSNLNSIYINPVYSDNNCKAVINSDLLYGSIYFKINFINNASGSVNINVSGPSHNHSYSDWLYLNDISHIEVCECGQTGVITKPHAIRQNELGNLFSICIDCGARITIGDGIIETPGINNFAKVTINGSYMLQNGIIVLVDEDISMYLNGTLIFYDFSQLPEKG